MKYFSMFSGIGGFEYGIDRAYWKHKSREKDIPPSRNKPHNSESSGNKWKQDACVGFSEIDKYAIQIYKKHFPQHKEYGDATRIIPEEIPDFDLLVGGFPCQSFSIAGKRGGFKDIRGNLFFEIARIISVKRPKLLLLENVKGLLSHDKGRTFGTILATLSDLGYVLEWQVLNSKDYGVPQNRERVFIIGHLGKTCGQTVFPIGKEYQNNIERNEQKNRREVSNAITGGYKTQNARGTYIIHKNTKIRRLTPTECERLQGFPDDWTEGISDTQRYKCLGNAVTTNVVTTIMKRILNIMAYKSKK